jgi:Tat protein translocase TatB subunit
VNILGMGPLELLVIVALALVVFGPEKLPEMAQQVGKAIREIRRVTSDVTDEIQRSIEPERPTIRPPADSITRSPVDSGSSPTSDAASAPPPPSRPATQKEKTIEPPY